MSIEARQELKDMRKYWDRDHINQVLDTIPSQNISDKMFLSFLWMSGVRVTEAISLQKKDIDFQNYVMTVKWQKSHKYLRRVVPIFPTLRDKLEVYTAPMKSEDRVFPFTRQNGWRIVQKYFQGFPHQFRHSFAVNWLRCGGELTILSRMLGHSDIRTTMQYLLLCPIDQGKELVKIRFR